jgi:uncharacterized protein (TIGR03435 family)
MVGKILAVGLVCAGIAIGQTAVSPAAAGTAAAPAAATPTKDYAFEVVSIRRNLNPQGTLQYGPTADGYRGTNVPMFLLFNAAYTPQVGGAVFYGNDQLKGLPDWISERYDIDARISDADRAEWQKPESQKVMLQAMLQAMFVDRCKMVVHREVKEVAVNSLVLAKGGPKFKETDPTVKHPGGMKLPWGGVLVPSSSGLSVYGASMASFASIISSVGRPVQDKTGLTGKYDITMKLPAPSASAPGEQQDGPTASDPGFGVDSALSDLGLKLEPGKGQVETLVIDHIERPSPN